VRRCRAAAVDRLPLRCRTGGRRRGLRRAGRVALRARVVQVGGRARGHAAIFRGAAQRGRGEGGCGGKGGGLEEVGGVGQCGHAVGGQ